MEWHKKWHRRLQLSGLCRSSSSRGVSWRHNMNYYTMFHQHRSYHRDPTTLIVVCFPTVHFAGLLSVLFTRKGEASTWLLHISRMVADNGIIANFVPSTNIIYRISRLNNTKVSWTSVKQPHSYDKETVQHLCICVWVRFWGFQACSAT